MVAEARRVPHGTACCVLKWSGVAEQTYGCLNAKAQTARASYTAAFGLSAAELGVCECEVCVGVKARLYSLVNSVTL